MGTRWRGLLAPINRPTGDGRRMADGSIRWRELPVALKWQRTDSDGHDDSVIIGHTDTINLGTVEQATANGWISEDAVANLNLDPNDMGAWGGGELFDDANPVTLPRLAEDVAEAQLLLERGVIGPSVDAGAATVVLVRAGSDTPLTDEELDDLLWGMLDSGEEPDLEMLFLDYEIAAATLVAIPAFAQCQPFELLADSPVSALTAADTDPTDAPPPVDAPTAAALLASYTAAAVGVPADVFTPPTFAEYTPITWTLRPDGLLAVAGHFAPEGACHLGFRDVCRTPPETRLDYAPFHRYPVQLDTGELTSAGRITTGFGQIGTGCVCCRGKGDHACDGLDLAAAITHHDKLTRLAYVRAGRDEFGQFIVGYADPDLSDQARAVLGAGKFSGDWRDYGGNLELVELVGLTTAQPAFPAPRIRTRNGRRLALTAAFAPPRTRPSGPAQPTGPDLATQVADALAPSFAALDERIRGLLNLATTPAPAPVAEPAPEPVAVTAAAHTGAMVALIPADADATRLAVDGGEPVDELHMTIAYLGEAADIPDDVQQATVDALRRQLATMVSTGGGPVQGRTFAVNVFNPDAEDTETAIVLGVDGDQLTPFHGAIVNTLHQVDGLSMPEQHAPWVAHITLIYSDDLGLVAKLTDRTGQDITFDRLRVAFAGVNTDLPLAGEPVDEAAILAAEVDAAISEVLEADRAAAAAALWRELEATHV